MNTRAQAEKNTINYSPYLKPAAQAVLTSSWIAAAAYIPEIILMQKQTGASVSGMSFTGYLLSNYKVLATGFQRSIGHSLTRNGFMTNKDMVQVRMQENFSTHENMNEFNASEGRFYQPQLKAQFAAALVTAGALSSVELACTHYFAVMKAFNMQNRNPYLSGIKDNMRFVYRIGLTTRGFGTGANAVSYILGQSLLKDQLYTQLPHETYGPLAGVLATGLTGGIGGTCNHFSSLVFANIIKNTEVKIFSSKDVAMRLSFEELRQKYKCGERIPYQFEINAPTMRTMTKEIFKNEGLYGFTKGSLWSIGITTMAYTIYRASEKTINYFFPEEPSANAISQPKVSNNPSSLFAQSKKIEPANPLEEIKPRSKL